MAWTVTSGVETWVDGTANNGRRVTDSVESPSTKCEAMFRSREEAAVTAERAKLDVMCQ